MKDIDRFALLQFAAKGKTKAHQFIHECAARPLISMNSANKHILGDKARFFIPPINENDTECFGDNDCDNDSNFVTRPNNENDRIIMFSDNSGIYIDAEEFFPVHLSNDISQEISQWTEIPQL